MRHVGDGRPRSREQVERLIAARERFWCVHGFGVWTLYSRELDDIVGHTFLGRLSCTSNIEMGYLLCRETWGRGVATEAARATLQYGFRHVGLPRIVATVHPDNTASRRVQEKLGMSLLENGRCRGHQMFGITRREWRPVGENKTRADFRNVHLCPLPPGRSVQALRTYRLE